MEKDKELEIKTLYTSREAAKFLGVTPRTVQLWTDSGILKARKTLGGHRRFLASTLEEFLQQQEQQEAELHVVSSRDQASNDDRIGVLVVEDEPDLRTLYEMTMQGWDFPVDIKTAQDGYEGLINLGRDQPDVMILDLNLPRMDGFFLINVIQKMQPSVDSKIVVVTALTPSDITAHGGIPEPIQVFHKPIPFQDLEQLIRSVWEKKLQKP